MTKKFFAMHPSLPRPPRYSYEMLVEQGLIDDAEMQMGIQALIDKEKREKKAGKADAQNWQ